MSRSLIQVANPSTVAIVSNAIIPLGSVQRRFGCNLRLSGNAIECVGAGYYTIEGTVSVAPTAEGDVTVGVFVNGVQLPGAIAYGSSTAGSAVTLPLEATVRVGCCDTADNITLVLLAGDGAVQNVSLRVEKA